MFTNATRNTSNWLQQKDHGSSIYTRPVLVLVGFSLGPRSSLVRLSLLIR